MVPAPGQKLPFAVGPRAATAAWAAPDGKLVRVHGKKPTAVAGVPTQAVLLAFGHSGSPLALVGDRGNKHVVMLARSPSEPLREISTLPAASTALAFAHDDARFAVGDASGAVRLVDVPDAKVGAPLQVASGQTISAVALSQDGTLLAAGTPSGQVDVQQLPSGVAHRVYSAASAVRCLAWSVGGRGLVVGTAGGRIWLIDTAGSRALALLTAPSAVKTCVRSPGDDRFTFVTRDGMVWQRELELDPIWMINKPVDALDPHAAALPQWKGLGRSERPD